MPKSIFKRVAALFSRSKGGGRRQCKGGRLQPLSLQSPSLSSSPTLSSSSRDGSSRAGSKALVRLTSWFECTKKLAPEGYISVEVGKKKIRHIIPIKYLYHKNLQQLLDASEAEFGHSYSGPLQLVCDEEELKQVLHTIHASFFNEGERPHVN